MAKKFTRYFVGDYKIDGFINISLVEACSKIKDKVALDTETTWDEAKEILTVQITGKDYTILVDVQEGFSKMLLGKLKKIGWICHNGKFDYSVIKRHTGYVHNDVDDTMVMGQLIKLGLTNPKGTFSLESMAREYVDKYAYTLQTDLFDYTVTKDIRRTFGGKLTPQQAAYAAKDTEYTYTLYEVLHAKMEKDGLLDVYNLVEKEFILVLADMELNGVDVNRDKWNALIKHQENEIEKSLEKLSVYGDINWNSPKQVLDLMKNTGVSVSFIDKKTGEIKEGVNSTVLSKIDNELVHLYLEYKKLMKLKTSYGEKFLSKISPLTGKIHSSYMQMVDTGRTSSSNPNMQQIPRMNEYRNCFEAGEGYSFVTADYSSQEVLIAADLYGETKILDWFKEGVDLHLKTASVVWGENMIPSLHRQIAKTIVFTILYDKIKEG